MPIRLQRIYDALDPAESDPETEGRRILVERLWPRGISKEKARLDLWARDAAPSPELRRWFHQDFSRWDEFRRRYRAELEANGEALAELHRHVAHGPVTFLYAASDREHNSAVLLKDFLEERGD